MNRRGPRSSPGFTLAQASAGKAPLPPAVPTNSATCVSSRGVLTLAGVLAHATAAPTLRATAALALSYACAYGMHPALLQPSKAAAAAAAGTEEAAAAGDPMAVESTGDAGPESKVQKTEADSTAGASGTAGGTAAKTVYDEVADRVLELLQDKEPKVVGRAAAAAGYLAGGWGGAWAGGADGGGAGGPAAAVVAAVGGRLLGGLFGLSGSKSEDVQFAGACGCDVIDSTHAPTSEPWSLKHLLTHTDRSTPLRLTRHSGRGAGGCGVVKHTPTKDTC